MNNLSGQRTHTQTRKCQRYSRSCLHKYIWIIKETKCSTRNNNTVIIDVNISPKRKHSPKRTRSS